MLFESQIRDLKKLLPWNRVQKRKTDLRELMRQKLRIQKPEDLQAWSEAVIDRIEQMHAFRHAHVVMFYYPVHHEVDLRPLLTKYPNKMFLFPVTRRRSMEVRPYDGEDMMRRGRLGVPEPQTDTYHGPIDLILVPGVVFDQHCHRIGRGGGYYDKFLLKHPAAMKIGVCYDFQLKKHSIPHRWGDRKMDRVVSPTRTIG